MLKKITPTISPEGGLCFKIEGRQNHKRNQEKINNIKEQNQLPMSSINEEPLIQKVGELAMASNKKDDKYNCTSNKDKKLWDIFIDTLLQPEQWLKETHDEMNEKIFFIIEQIAALTKQNMEIVAKQPNILKVSATSKNFLGYSWTIYWFTDFF